jgi:hypothetical protein
MTFTPSGAWKRNSDSARIQVEALVAELDRDDVSEQVDDARAAHVAGRGIDAQEHLLVGRGLARNQLELGASFIRTTVARP